MYARCRRLIGYMCLWGAACIRYICACNHDIGLLYVRLFGLMRVYMCV